MGSAKAGNADPVSALRVPVLEQGTCQENEKEMTPRYTCNRLVKSMIEIIHEVLVIREIPEELRLKLTEWRTLAEMVVDGEDDGF